LFCIVEEAFGSESLSRYAEQLPLLHDLFTKPIKTENFDKWKALFSAPRDPSKPSK